MGRDYPYIMYVVRIVKSNFDIWTFDPNFCLMPMGANTILIIIIFCSIFLFNDMLFTIFDSRYQLNQVDEVMLSTWAASKTYESQLKSFFVSFYLFIPKKKKTKIGNFLKNKGITNSRGMWSPFIFFKKQDKICMMLVIPNCWFYPLATIWNFCCIWLKT